MKEHVHHSLNELRSRQGAAAACLAVLIFSIFILFGSGIANGQVSEGPPAKPQPKQKRKTAPARPALTEAEIQEARTLLGDLGYWVDPEAKGLDVSLKHALIAFQKVEGRNLTGRLTSEEIEALRMANRPQALESGYPHIEVDLSRQVLFVVDCCGAILRILPVSSGSGEWFTEGGRTRQAVTPTGRFKITRKIAELHKSPLGLLYYPSYFYDGIAIHGNPAVPTRPASHGCVRIPMFAAKEFFEMATVGMVVIVHEGGLPKPEPLPFTSRQQ
ncbi:MAG TPA: L,D-transpeptidase family protein [Blastocatellia bacterium]|nr:L,D-transpeptidase family protein [Blastocatellia bacterium]